jgi:hypothetical protein
LKLNVKYLKKLPDFEDLVGLGIFAKKNLPGFENLAGLISNILNDFEGLILLRFDHFGLNLTTWKKWSNF